MSDIAIVVISCFVFYEDDASLQKNLKTEPRRTKKKKKHRKLTLIIRGSINLLLPHSFCIDAIELLYYLIGLIHRVLYFFLIHHSNVRSTFPFHYLSRSHLHQHESSKHHLATKKGTLLSFP